MYLKYWARSDTFFNFDFVIFFLYVGCFLHEMNCARSNIQVIIENTGAYNKNNPPPQKKEAKTQKNHIKNHLVQTVLESISLL